MLYILRCWKRKGNTVTVCTPRMIRKRDSRPGCVLLSDWVTLPEIFWGQPYISIKVEHANHKERGQQQQSVGSRRISSKSCPKTTEILYEPCHMRELMKNDLYSPESCPKVPFCFCKYLHCSKYPLLSYKFESGSQRDIQHFLYIYVYVCTYICTHTLLSYVHIIHQIN